jgi:hypothetical protein
MMRFDDVEVTTPPLFSVPLTVVVELLASYVLDVLALLSVSVPAIDAIFPLLLKLSVRSLALFPILSAEPDGISRSVPDPPSIDNTFPAAPASSATVVLPLSNILEIV